MNDNERQREIEAVRSLLHNLVTEKRGDLSDPEVARVSVQLDELIVAYEKSKT